MKKVLPILLLVLLLCTSFLLLNHSPVFAGEWLGFHTITYESSQDEGVEVIHTTVIEYQLTDFLMADLAFEKNNKGFLVDLSGTVYFIDLFGETINIFNKNINFLDTNKIFTSSGVRYPFYNKDPIYYLSVTYRF
ncbi:MAG: hypothetical protein PWR10_1555 [Halanaerobiales bacterium]|nr:hypothetical protein [Halanaerobiales bacterium]